MKRNHIVFYLNETRYELSGNEIFISLAEFVRYHLSLTGTKIVCAEGDCGACTVLLGNIHERDGDAGKLRYKAINSCIIPLFLLDCCHVITVEGLKEGEKLHPVQEAIAKHHGTQCGYCTPGIACSLAACAEDSTIDYKTITRKKAANYLTGNLCRCTGYQPILDAIENVDLRNLRSLRDRYHDEKRNEELIHLSQIPVDIRVERESDTVSENPINPLSDGTSSSSLRVFLPVTIEQAIRLKREHPDLRPIAGGTDIGVITNKGKFTPTAMLALCHIPESYQIKMNESEIWVGAQVTLSRLEDAVKKQLPEMARLLRIFASPQIKNQGTLIGNVANGSPIGDSLPYLVAADARVRTSGHQGNRNIPLGQFYLGYRKLDLRDNEIITGITIPIQNPNEQTKLYKVSLRKDLDISAVTFAGIISVDPGTNRITKIRIAYGGVGPTVLRLPQMEAELFGQTFERSHFENAANRMNQIINPLSDLRGSREYRLLLCRNLLFKFYDEIRMFI